ncbi:hypothetical protein SAMN04487770_12668 [Butyrivibrio sp. ob235]|nr:hypothetical protein SAMN04487770_12668 [Butyrivibrio sp. ob235]
MLQTVQEFLKQIISQEFFTNITHFVTKNCDTMQNIVFKKEINVMKKRILAMCFAVSISTMLIACGGASNSTVDVQEEEIAEAAESEASEAAEEAASDVTEADVSDIVGDVTEAGELAGEEAADGEDKAADAGEDGATDAGEDSAVDYSVFTSASSADVEAYAQKIVDATNAKDWDTIGDMIEYPIGSEELGNLCNNKEEFVAYANDKGFDEEALAKLQSWSVSDLWANYMGASIGDGDIWFRDLSLDNPEFKIVSYLGLYESEAGGEISE